MTARPRQAVTADAIAAAVRAESLLRPWGAQARVAKRLGCDRATVTRAMRRAAPVDDLAYTPAPGELALKAQQAQDAALLQMELLRQLVLTPVVAPIVADLLHALPAPCAPPQQSRPAATIASVTVRLLPSVRNVARERETRTVAALIWLLVSACVVVTASVLPGLGSVLLLLCVGALAGYLMLEG
jgi:hypothetical protein